MVGYHGMLSFSPSILITFDFPVLPTVVIIVNIDGSSFFSIRASEHAEFLDLFILASLSLCHPLLIYP